PRRDVDWTLLDTKSVATRLSHWDEAADAEKTCMQGASRRCTEMRRFVDEGGGVSGVQPVIDDVNAALPILKRLWSEEFARIGRTFAAPDVAYYGVGTGIAAVFEPADVAKKAGDCMKPFDNSLYCPSTNTVYLDAVYLTKVARAVHEADGTTGRFAAIAVAAHEIGHAVHVQTGDAEGDKHAQELLADCFAGAGMAALRRSETGVGQSKAAQVLYTSDALAEGQLGIALIGGPKMVDGIHEAGPVRADYYTRGFNMGFGSCADRFKPR
ncbi:MAG TPA: neutral zinc metallopeptidase, partial [Vicinamibacterales bacterium]|nr:neutral zinc metallopeptidase [Vicinamibacterales bacterium]